MSQFQSLSEQVYELYSSLFDADPATLDYINLYPDFLITVTCITSINEVHVACYIGYSTALICSFYYMYVWRD